MSGSTADRAARLGGSLPEAVAALAELDRRIAELRERAEAHYFDGEIESGDKLGAEMAAEESLRPAIAFKVQVLTEAARRVAAEVRAEELRAEIEAAEKHAETVARDARELAAQVRPAVAVARETIRRAVNSEKAANFAAADVLKLRATAEGRELHREPGIQFSAVANMTGKSALLSDLLYSGEADF